MTQKVTKTCFPTVPRALLSCACAQPRGCSAAQHVVCRQRSPMAMVLHWNDLQLTSSRHLSVGPRRAPRAIASCDTDDTIELVARGGVSMQHHIPAAALTGD